MRYALRLILAGLVIGIGSWLVVSGSAQDAAKRKDSKVGHFSGVTIKKEGGPAALDIRLDGKGKAIQFYVAPVESDPQKDNPRTYFNDAGMLYTNGWIVVSGVYSGHGEGFNIEPPTQDPSMLAVWSDILGPAIQVRAANAGADSYIFQALDRKANYTFSIEQNGTLRWGAAARAEMDANLYRAKAKTLKTDGSLVVAEKLGVGTSDPASTLHVKGSQSVQRTPVQTDYVVTDGDYYIGVTSTEAPATVTLPAAAGREGRVYIIKDESGEAATRPITVKAQAGETIDGAETMTISTNYGVLRVVSSGTSWFGM